MLSAQTDPLGMLGHANGRGYSNGGSTTRLKSGSYSAEAGTIEPDDLRKWYRQFYSSPVEVNF